jgi:hypothetical protein
LQKKLSQKKQVPEIPMQVGKECKWFLYRYGYICKATTKVDTCGWLVHFWPFYSTMGWNATNEHLSFSRTIPLIRINVHGMDHAKWWFAILRSRALDACFYDLELASFWWKWHKGRVEWWNEPLISKKQLLKHKFKFLSRQVELMWKLDK